ncbi:phosphotransferase-like protein [Halobacillus massiliensis]|uniref:phosphotransferase-like protein n=1 Tax=Halobacillus massiliensis TaxID=1926286 RepID=UPI0015C4DC91|nr:AAA family ATPase [Halobacillus massiliensis]
MKRGNIIFLNGVSSSGKTTLAFELASKLHHHFPLSLDQYDDLIASMENREQEKLIPVPTEHFFHQTITMFSDRGIDLIVDHLLHNEHTMQDAFAVLKDYPVFFVGVHCPLEVLNAREKARGDRTIGQAEKQLEFVHQQGEVYDVAVDTSKEGAADIILNLLKKQERYQGWKTTVQKNPLP